MPNRLNDRIDECVQSLRDGHGAIPTQRVVSLILPELTPDEREQLASRALYKLVNDRARRGIMELRARAGSDQPSLPFKLDERYALDIEERVIKDTANLTRTEVRRVIQIRRDQIKADRAKLEQLEQAEAAAAPYWDQHPDWTFGEALYAAARDGATCDEVA